MNDREQNTIGLGSPSADLATDELRLIVKQALGNIRVGARFGSRWHPPLMKKPAAAASI